MRSTSPRRALSLATVVLAATAALACSGVSVPGVTAGECVVPERSMRAKSPAAIHPGAVAGFESIDATFTFVDAPFAPVGGCAGAHTQPLTHGADALDDVDRAYRHLSQLTFVAHDPDVLAVGDLFLHGDDGDDGYIAMWDVDLRKFLYQDVVLHDCDDDDDACDDERLPGPGNAWRGAESPPDSVANEPFDSDAFACIRNVHGYFAEFNRISKKIPEADDSGRRFHLTNNCREPGNYELALLSADEEKLYGNHVSLDIEFYRQVMRQIDVEMSELGTGLRVVGTDRSSSGRYDYEELEAPKFPKQCGLENLAPFVGKAQRLLTPKPVAIDIDTGKIAWDDFPSETHEKSGRGAEPITYVQVRRGESAPSGFDGADFWFRTADDGVIERYNNHKTWSELQAKASDGTVYAPHTFTTWSQVHSEPFAVSAFEVDGRYLGRVTDRRLQTDSARMYPMKMHPMKRWTTAEVRATIEPNGSSDTKPQRIELRLLDGACSYRSCANLVIGNLLLEPGEATQMILGIGTQPLRELYENDVQQAYQQYALAYDHADNIAKIDGIGMVIVRRGEGRDKHTFTVDLISYERAVPTWRGTIEVPAKPPKLADRPRDGRDGRDGKKGRARKGR